MGTWEKIEKFQILVSCVIVTLGVLIAAAMFCSRIQKNENITVTGSASKIVKSDSASLRFEIQSRAHSQKEAFSVIKNQTPVVVEYLTSKGISKEDISVKAIGGYYSYKMNQNGYNTNEIAAYNANCPIEIKSKDVLKIKEISTSVQNLVDKGIDLSISSPEYYYSDLASIKIDLLKEATQDAKHRATSMLSATGAHVGKVKQMRMGVFQITPPDSTTVSDWGVNDTTTIDKKVTAVANVVFKVR